MKPPTPEIQLKILADETGKQLWEENCLMQRKGTIRELVMEAKEKFTPIGYKKGTLILRNVTTYSAKYAGEVSVDLDGKAVDGSKYTVYFIFNEETSAKAESSSMKSINEKALTAEFLAKQTHLEKLDNDLIAIRKQKEAVEQAMQIEMDKNDKLLKSQQSDLKKAQNQLDECKKEVDAKRKEKKALNERIDKKSKELDSIKKQIKEKDKKLENCKKDLSHEVEELDKIIKKKAKALEECQQLQEQKEQSTRLLEDLRNEELCCRRRIDEMQQEEKQFHLMLQELREHLGELQQQCQWTPPGNEPIHTKAFTRQCVYYQKGTCAKGDNCQFIHQFHQQQNQRQPNQNGLGQIPQQQVPYMQQFWQEQYNQLFQQNQSFGGEYQINGQFGGGGQFMQQQGHKRGQPQPEDGGNGNNKMMRRE